MLTKFLIGIFPIGIPSSARTGTYIMTIKVLSYKSSINVSLWHMMPVALFIRYSNYSEFSAYSV